MPPFPHPFLPLPPSYLAVVVPAPPGRGELCLPPPSPVTLSCISLSSVPLAQVGEVTVTEGGCCPAVIVWGGGASADHPRLLHTSLSSGRRRYRYGHGPLLLPIGVQVAGEASLRLFDLGGEGGSKLAAWRFSVALAGPPASDPRHKGAWHAVSFVSRAALGIPSCDTRFTPDFHIAVGVSSGEATEGAPVFVVCPSAGCFHSQLVPPTVLTCVVARCHARNAARELQL